MAMTLCDACSPTGSVVMQPPNSVDCGGHFATHCSLCPLAHGHGWCNGECQWVSTIFGGECRPLSPVFGLAPPGLHSLGSDSLWWSLCFLWSAIIMLLFACVYKSQVVSKLSQIPRDGSSTAERLSLFACLSDPSTCLYTTFCMPVVLGKNYYVANMMGFWPGCIFSFLLTFSPLYCLAVCVRAVLAKKVQEQLGQDTGLLSIILATVFCMPCDVGRESMEVDGKIGAEITCCFQVGGAAKKSEKPAPGPDRKCLLPWEA